MILYSKCKWGGVLELEGVNSVTSKCIRLKVIDWLESTYFSDVSDVSYAFNWLDMNILFLTSETSWFFFLAIRLVVFSIRIVACLVSCLFLKLGESYLAKQHERM